MHDSKVAIIMSGHQRMVPYGYKINREILDTLKIKYDFFSYTWTNLSESKSINLHKNLNSTNDIILNLGNHSVHVDQEIVVKQLYDNIVNFKKIKMPKEHFYRFVGQIYGFFLALDKWKEELKEYDYIIRSRWDTMLYPHTIETLLKEGKESSIFYTKSCNIYRGTFEISGDVIYGTSKYWLKYFTPIKKLESNLIKTIKTLSYNNQDISCTNDQYLWCSSHSIWAILFKNTNISIISNGESFYIDPKKYLELDINTFTLNDDIDYAHILNLWKKDVIIKHT